MKFEVIGAPAEATEYLASGKDVCFGKFYAKSNPVCQACRAPVAHAGKVVLLKELCSALCAKQSTIARLNKLTSQEVLERLERQVPLSQIFREILGKAPVKQLGAEARQLLVDRLNYLNHFLKIEVPKVPRLKELCQDDVHRDS